MINAIRSTIRSVQGGINTGIILGMGLIFLTLIGLPSDDSTQLAATTIPLYLLIAAGVGWQTTKRLRREEMIVAIQNAIAAGMAGAVVLLLFLGLINRWHTEDIDVAGLYFANMNTYPIHVLSGVPLEELEPNTPVDPVTNELPPNAYVRTDPFTFSTTKDVAFVTIGDEDGGLGGFYALALLLVLASVTGGLIEQTLYRVNWHPLRARLQTATEGDFFHKILPGIIHWLFLLSPVFIFLLFWASVEHERSTEQSALSFFFDFSLGLNIFGDPDFGSFQLIDLNDVFNLSNDSLINDVSIQLGMAFLLIIMAIVALRRVRLEPSPFNYGVRLAFNLIPFLMLSFLALWRVEASQINIIAPGFEALSGFDQHDWTLLLMGSVWLILFGYIVGSQINATNFELTITVSLGLTAFLIAPLFMTQYQTFVVGRVMLAVMFGLGLNIVVGYAGLLDLGYVAFYAIGAYTFAFIAYGSEQYKLINSARLNSLGWTTLAAVLLAPILMLLFAFIWQLINSRKTVDNLKASVTQNYRIYETNSGLLRKAKVWENQPPAYITAAIFVVVISFILGIGYRLNALDLGTLDAYVVSSFLVAIPLALMAGAFAGIALGFPVLRLRGDYLAIVTLGFGEIISLALKNLDSTTGGPSGAIGIPKPVPDGTAIPVSNLVLLYISVVGGMLVLLVSSNLRNSRIGRAWLAMRSDEDIAQAMGINLVNVKLLAFSLGASMAALAGMIFASRQSSIFPDDFNLEISINVLSLVIIGGMGSLPGVVVGSIVLIGLPELLRPIADYRIMAFGLLLILTMVTRPQGLVPAPPPELEARARQLAEAEAQSDVE